MQSVARVKMTFDTMYKLSCMHTVFSRGENKYSFTISIGASIASMASLAYSECVYSAQVAFTIGVDESACTVPPTRRSTIGDRVFPVAASTRESGTLFR